MSGTDPNAGSILAAHQRARAAAQQQYEQQQRQHSMHVKVIRDCRAFFLRIRDFQLRSDAAEEELQRTGRRNHPSALDGVLLREFARRVDGQCELQRCPLGEGLQLFHAAAVAYAAGDARLLGGAPALVDMQKSLLLLLRRRVSLLMRALFYDRDSDAPVVRECEQDDDEEDDEEAHDVCDGAEEGNAVRSSSPRKARDRAERRPRVIMADGGAIAHLLLGATNGYFALRRLRPTEPMRLVSDVAPHIMDLAAFEIGLAVLLQQRGWRSTERSGASELMHPSAEAAVPPFDAAAALSRVEALSGRLPIFEKRDDGVQIGGLSLREREFRSGFAGRTAAFVRLWLAQSPIQHPGGGGGALLRWTEQDARSHGATAAAGSESDDDADDDSNNINNGATTTRASEEAAAVQARRLRNFSYSAGSILNSFLNARGRKHRERLLALKEERERREEAERSRRAAEERARRLQAQREALQRFESKLVPAASVARLNLIGTEAIAVGRRPRRRGRSSASNSDNSSDGGEEEESAVRALPFELLCDVFALLLPSELVAAATTCRAWQRVVIARPLLRWSAQLSVTFTRNVRFFLRESWGAQCVAVDVVCVAQQTEQT